MSREQRALMRAAVATFAANLVSMLVSVPEITGPQFWILLGILLTCLRHAWLVENGVLAAPTDEWQLSYDELRSLEASYGDVSTGLRPTTP